MLIAGIDEAGRGPVLGPMVLAVASIEKNLEERLLEIGVRDSKLLSKAQREEQFNPIKSALKEFATVHIQPEEIDSLRTWKSLNEIEAMRIGALLNNLKEKPEIVFIDAPDIKQENFGKRIRKYINFQTILRTEHKADLNYPIVSAASIIAKIERDAAIEELAKKAGCRIGSGYPHDPDTISFLNDCIKKNNQLPGFARKSWQTTRNILDKKFQKKLVG
ncbi:MAG: ribonuclease HII [Candidatus ainarchaeum sp.]|nr:ribonuclease HII [Candidatus ainarchaeum sp.]